MVRLISRVNSTVSLLTSILTFVEAPDISIDTFTVIGNSSRSIWSSSTLPERVVVRPTSIVGSFHENFVHLSSSITMSSSGAVGNTAERSSERDCPSIPESSIKLLIISVSIVLISSGISASNDSESVALASTSNLSCPGLGDDISSSTLPLVVGSSPHPILSN
ncbi:hypothetical protein ES703_112968 [subsurface metagenome]